MSVATPGIVGINISNLTGNLELTDLEIVELSINSVLFILISVGNMLTIIAVYKTPDLQTIPNMFVVSLAVADFLTGFAVVYYMINLIPFFTVYFNHIKYLCILRYTLAYTYVAQSVFSLSLIALDRMFYIRYPLKYRIHVTSHNAGIVIGCSWILSVTIGSVPLYNHRWSDEIGCTNNLTKEFQIYGSFSVFLACVLCTFYCYFVITRTAIRQRRAIKAQIRDSLVSSCKHIDKGYLKSVELFAIVFLSFLLFWSPLICLSFIIQFSTIFVPSWCIYVAITFGYINSGTNFLIYAWRNKQFRKAFLKILSCE